MKLYINGISKWKQTYTPDWIQVEACDGNTYCFDIRGEIDVEPNTFNCRVKGDLVLWTINGEELETKYPKLKKASYDELVEFSARFLHLIGTGECTIGLYQFEEKEGAGYHYYAEDEITDCTATLYRKNDEAGGETEIINFTYTTEYNG